ncbi:phosphotriesterase-related protein [Neocloeon triangulifer]|uniref:phosphotriesterase-related protein n=1 Tax=Neocloeon triangulifer TaxID=2078957 RepID=UPI00286F5CC9|nr:phosphotriesterase-related protein [Neocloeon triangulifer]
MSGKKVFHVQTVLGLVDVNELGRTLTHEHVSATVAEKPEVFYRPAPDNVASLPSFNDKTITLENAGIVRQYPYSNVFNMAFQDSFSHQAVVEDLKIFKNSGGGTIVENTCPGIGRNVEFMVHASKAAGLHIIAGTGFYVKEAYRGHEALLGSSVEELAKTIRTDLTEGCPEKPEVKCGVIAEVGSGWPISVFEKRAIQATAIVQAELGCGASFHPGRDSGAPEEIARIYLEAGGAKDKAVLSHLDRTLHTKEDLLSFAETGFYCQYDLFGQETSLYQLNNQVDMPSDAERVNRIKWLVEDGRADKITVAHDIHTKHRLLNYGGHGYAHILLNVVPQMRVKGLSDDVINGILIRNPRTWLGVDPNYQPKAITLL